MKSTYMFRDQVNTVTNWFSGWNECEQTVALYSLLRKITPAQARFLQQVLGQSVSCCSTDMQLLESQANNPAYINSLCKESKEQAVTGLLQCLPLLKPHNEEAKQEYLQIIPKILAHSIDNGCHIEESRQLLSYSLIHPAITSNERAQFNLWLSHLEDRFMPGNCQQGVLDAHSQPPQPHTQNVAHHGINGWQQQQQQQHQHPSVGTSRDSGIAMSESDASCGLQSFSVSSSNIGVVAPGGRPITSTTSTSGGSVGDVTVAVSSLSNGTSGLMPPQEHPALQATLSGPAAFNSVPSSQGGMPIQSAMKSHRKLARVSTSAAPPNGGTLPSAHVRDWLNKHHNEMVHGTRSQQPLQTSQEHPHAPLSPQSSVSSSGSGSDSHHEDSGHGNPGQGQARNTFLEDKSGMRDVPIWLKSLRLHKYSLLFQQLKYTDMLNLTENWLESQGVTKGARNKIIISIKKLRDRQNALRCMEKDIMEYGNLKPALSDLKSILNTPIKAYSPADLMSKKGKSASKQSEDSDSSGKSSTEIKESEQEEEETRESKAATVGTVSEADSIPEGDIPGQMTRVLGKLCTQLSVTTRLEDECCSLYLQLLDKCMMHEAFTVDQKKKLLSWKQQIQKIWQPAHRKYSLEQRKGFGHLYAGNLLRGQRALRGQQQLMQQQQQQQQTGQAKWTFNSRQAVTVGGAPMAAAGTNLPHYHNALNAAFATQPAMFEIPKQGVTRTHSAPIKSSHYGLSLSQKPVQDMSVTEPEITARLDSLCLSMTEHALGGLGDAEAGNLDRGATF